MGILVNDGNSKPVNLNGYSMNKALTISQPLINALKGLISDNVTVYFRAHGYHWNVQGQDFTEYHILFGEIYEDLYHAVDPTAENIRVLGDFAPYRLQDFMQLRSVMDSPVPAATPIAMALDLLRGIDDLLTVTNKSVAIATQLNEQGVLNFLVGRVEMLQKWKWQLTASLQ